MPSPEEISQNLISILEKRGQGDYIGESISQLEHCLQTADQARKAGSFVMLTEKCHLCLIIHIDQTVQEAQMILSSLLFFTT